MEQAIDIVKERIRKDRNNARYKKTNEEIICAYCKKIFIVEKSYGTWRNGKRIIPKHRFCCRDHAWKWYSQSGEIKNRIAAKGEDNINYKIVDIKKIEQRIQEGKSYFEIAKELGVHKSTIYKRIKKFCIKRINKELESKIVSTFLNRGTPYSRLAIEYNMGTIAMKNLLSRNGLNYRMNRKHAKLAESDKVAMNYLTSLDYHVVRCGNLCLEKNLNCFPLEICNDCTIRLAGKLEFTSFFDCVAIRDGKYYLVEVKEKYDNFSWNQMNNLLEFKNRGGEILVIRTKQGKVIYMKKY